LLVHIGDPSSNQATTLESQMIHMIQELFGQTLRAYKKEELMVTVSAAVQLFALCGLGMLEYVGKRNGQGEFRASPDFDAKAKEYERCGITTGLIEVLGESEGVVVLRPVSD